MSKIGVEAAADVAKTAQRRASPQPLQLSEDDRSKDAFFVQIAEIAEAMIARHGKDFAIGSLILAAKFIAEGKPLINRTNGGGEKASVVKPD
jgi:hypothetical protein